MARMYINDEEEEEEKERKGDLIKLESVSRYDKKKICSRGI